MDILKGFGMEEILKKQEEQHSKKSKQQWTVKRTDIRLKDIAILNKKVMRNIRHIAKKGVFIVLPVTRKRGPTWKHPTVFGIMNLGKGEEVSDIFTEPSKYRNIWSDFDSLKPFKVVDGKFRAGLTEPMEVYICLKF